MYTAFGDIRWGFGSLEFFGQVVGFEICFIFIVPLFAKSAMVFPLALGSATSLLSIFLSYIG